VSGSARVTVGLGVLFLGLAAWAAVHPRSFATVLADFGPFNAHLVHDFAASSAAFGLGLVLAGRIPSWRVPVLTLAALWNGLHALSHLADVGDASSPVVGWAEVALLAAGTAVLLYLTGTQRTLSAKEKGKS